MRSAGRLSRVSRLLLVLGVLCLILPGGASAGQKALAAAAWREWYAKEKK